MGGGICPQVLYFVCLDGKLKELGIKLQAWYFVLTNRSCAWNKHTKDDTALPSWFEA